jgi:hypothetical protein
MNWDKLAQRNLQITNAVASPLPQLYILPQAFDLRPSALVPSQPTNTYLDIPDELVINWENTPVGNTASFYWPQLNAADVLALANQIYATHRSFATDTNTIQFVVPKGITYIPVPSARAKINFAGLVTITLPKMITAEHTFNIALQRYSSRSFVKQTIPRLQIAGKPVAKSITQYSAAMPRIAPTSSLHPQAGGARPPPHYSHPTAKANCLASSSWSFPDQGSCHHTRCCVTDRGKHIGSP